MATKISDLFVKVGADTKEFDRALGQARRQWSDFGSSLQSVGMKMTGAITLPLVGLGAAALRVGSMFEQATVGFTAMLGSGQRAGDMMKDLIAFAIKTPFEIPGLIDAARRLQALGFTANEVIPTLTTLGDAVSALGGSKEVLDRVILAIGQIRSKGTLQAQEMRQLAEAGIPAWEMLAKAIGKSIPDAMDMTEKKMIDSDLAISAIMKGMNERFGGMMALQARTLGGMWSNLKDQVTKALADIGQALAPAAKMMMAWASEVLAGVMSVARAFAALPAPIQAAMLGVAGVAALTGPLIVGLGLVASGIGNILGLIPLLTKGWGLVTRSLVLLQAAIAGTTIAQKALQTAMAATAGAQAASAGLTALSSAASGTALSYRNLSFAASGTGVGFAALRTSAAATVAPIVAAAGASGLLAPALVLVAAAIAGWQIGGILATLGNFAMRLDFVKSGVEKLKKTVDDLIPSFPRLKAAVINAWQSFSLWDFTGPIGGLKRFGESLDDLEKRTRSAAPEIAAALGDMLRKGLPTAEYAQSIITAMKKAFTTPVSMAFEVSGITPTVALQARVEELQKAYRVLAADRAKAFASGDLELAHQRTGDLAAVTKELEKAQADLAERFKQSGFVIGNLGEEAAKTAADMDVKFAAAATRASVEMANLRIETEKFQQDLRSPWTTETGRQFEAIQRSMFLLSGEALRFKGIELPDLFLDITKRGEEAGAGIDKFAEAFERLGVKSTASVKEQADKAVEAYEKISSNAQESRRAVLQSWIEMWDLQIDVARDKTSNLEGIQKQQADAAIADMERQADAAKRTLGNITGETQKHAAKQISVWKGLGREISTIFTDLSRQIADVIFKAKTLGEAFTQVAKDIAKAIIRFAIQEGLELLLKKIKEIIGLSKKIPTSIPMPSPAPGPSPIPTGGGGAGSTGGGGGGAGGGTDLTGLASLGLQSFYGAYQSVKLGIIQEILSNSDIRLENIQKCLQGYLSMTYDVLRFAYRDIYATLLESRQLLFQIHDVIRGDILSQLRGFLYTGPGGPIVPSPSPVTIAGGVAGSTAIDFRVLMVPLDFANKSLDSIKNSLLAIQGFMTPAVSTPRAMEMPELATVSASYGPTIELHGCTFNGPVTERDIEDLMTRVTNRLERARIRPTAWLRS